MKKKKETDDKTRNNNFAAAFDELRRNHGITTQLELARRMGVNKDTITNILKGYTEVTEDNITKLQTASGCIFNLQFLRGESDIMLARDAREPATDRIHNIKETPDRSEPPTDKDRLLESMDETIMFMRHHVKLVEEAAQREVCAKDETIASLKGQLADKDALNASLKSELSVLRQRLAELQQEKEAGKFPFPMGVADEKERKKSNV